MKTIAQRVQGKLVEEDGRFALLLLNDHPGKGAADLLTLRYAFVTQGAEEHIFPAFILDDWGNEIKSLELYDWFHQFADQFPRAELFGREKSGRETQLFLRELEKYSRHPCYAYQSPDSPLAEGVLVEAILLPDETAETPLKIKRPSGVKRPLRAARVTWQRIPDRLFVKY